MEIEKIAAQLKSFNPSKRRQALIYLAKHGGKEHLKLLKEVYLNDPEPSLRENAKQAAIYIRQRLDNPPQPEDSAPAPSKPSEERLRGAEKVIARRAEVEKSERTNLLIFGLVALVVGGVVLWALLGRQVLRVVDEGVLETRLREAASLSPSARDPAAAGEGKLYHIAFEDGSGFYLQEGSGPMPPEGWTLIVAFFNGGTGRDALSWLSRDAIEQNFMLLTPYVRPIEEGIGNFENAARLTTSALDIVRSNYQINSKKLTAYGYLRGANFLSSYTSRQPGEFAIISLTEATQYSQSPDLRARYFILGSRDNDVPDVTIDLITRLNVLQLNPIAQILTNTSDVDLQRRQWEGTLALIKAG
ncbi:MAG: hypothetical protein RML73_00305 [Anaerolineae bacterium]|nr:hypothetical protein [Anaerolineae bacterium]